MLSAAQLLDELMGRDRNLAPDEKRCNVRWDDENVCKYYLCEFCPAELFTNTRSDLGPCEKIHDENLRKQYEKSSRFMKVGYEREFLRYLQSLLAEVERRIRRGHARLALSQSQQAAGVSAVGPAGKNEEKVQVLTDKVEGLLLQIEELGSEGKVEEAQGMMKLVEQLKEERELLKSSTSTIESFAAQEKQMEVCEVCGAFLIVGDAQSRVDDHLMGKQHMGYAKIKSTVEELKEKLRKKSVEPEREPDRLRKERDDKDKDKDKERDRDREREEREKKRKRDEEEKEKEKEKEREKEREKEKERTREREKRKRSRSRSRNSSKPSDRRVSHSREHKRSRSRERKRSRSREPQRSRSHNRTERKHRSRSRDKRRSKSKERKSYKHRSRSRDRERRSKEREKRSSDDRKSSKSGSRDGQSESRKSDSKELPTLTSVNGSSEDIKSEGDTQSN
ncbi:luc7-like protein 3 isoform X1 [Rana temporaria]|uniref:luc7-like protein 3 isoform X1 n=1 Tax=Rana temporaria TaxID=8407 RepID=UPI001AAD7B8A|nr:luc7-like protein 3 isoform X1 [Rana temporaria]